MAEVEPAKSGWIKVRNDQNQEGLVPLDAIRKIFLSFFYLIFKVCVIGKKIKWKAIKDFEMEGQKQLISLKRGEIYDEVESEREHYVKLRNNEGAEGWAPVDCLVKDK